ncbi:hypothetical protein YPPY88_2058, partial [Yersinia pestis PY-88]
MPDAFLS